MDKSARHFYRKPQFENFKFQWENLGFLSHPCMIRQKFQGYSFESDMWFINGGSVEITSYVPLRVSPWAVGSSWQGGGRVKTYIGITPSITLSFLVRSQDNLGMKAILFNNHAVSCFKYTLKSENKTMFVLCWTTRTTLQPRSSSIFHFTPKYENICLIS